MPIRAVVVLAMPMKVRDPSNANCVITKSMPIGTSHACGVSSWPITTSWLTTRWTGRSCSTAGGAGATGSVAAAAGWAAEGTAAGGEATVDSDNNRVRRAAASATERYARGASALLAPITSSRSSARPTRRASAGRTRSTACSRSSGMARLRRHSSPSRMRSSRPTTW